MAMRSLETDYLVVGAGAMGMAFTDALIDHADVHVTLVDRRHAAGGHWQDAYPFVQLHQASVFYGVASTVLGTRRRAGPRPGGGAPGAGPPVGDPGLLRRHPASPLRRLGPRHLPRRERVPHRRRRPPRDVPGVGRDRARSTCDAGSSTPPTCRRRSPRRHPRRSASPTTSASSPSTSSPGWPRRRASYVIVGSGKTATDGIVWLLANGVQPDRIVWVRPRDPWMLNRAVVQPDPVVALGLAADTMAAAADAESLDDLFLRLEAAGVMLRIDRGRRAHDGQDADPRRVGARPAPHHRARRSPRTRPARDSRARSSSTTGRSRSRRARSSCTAPPPGCSTRRWSPSGGRTRSGSRRSGPASRASARRWPATWRRPATTTGSATGCARPTPSPTRPADWARMQVRGTVAARALRRRARHRRLGERLRAEPGAHRAVATRRPRGARPRPPAWPTHAEHGLRGDDRTRPPVVQRDEVAVRRGDRIRPRVWPATPPRSSPCRCSSGTRTSGGARAGPRRTGS